MNSDKKLNYNLEKLRKEYNAGEKLKFFGGISHLKTAVFLKVVLASGGNRIFLKIWICIAVRNNI